VGMPKKDDSASKKKKVATDFSAVGGLFAGYQLEDKGNYITQEFQDFGYRLSLELNDPAHKSLYIKLAKTVNRGLLEQALAFVADAYQAKSKAKLFMWKLKELRQNTKPKKSSSDEPEKR
jgi:hypothetical protein